jgi:hypothetical protein
MDQLGFGSVRSGIPCGTSESGQAYLHVAEMHAMEVAAQAVFGDNEGKCNEEHSIERVYRFCLGQEKS